MNGSIWVNCIATKLHLGDNTTLEFLWVKERAWSTASRSATADTGTLVDGHLKGGRVGKLSVLPPNLSSATVEPAYDLGEDNAVMNTTVSNIAKYNNNGQYKELTMLVGTISWHRAPLIIQSDPVCQKFD